MRRYEAVHQTIFNKTNGMPLMVLSIGILIGTIYAICLAGHYQLYNSIYQSVISTKSVVPIQILKDSMITYGWQLGLLIVCMLSKKTKGIGYIVSGGIAISYGFTVTALLLLYGWKGIVITVALLAVPIIAMMSTICITLKQGRTHIGKENQIFWMTLGVVGSGISVFNAYIQPPIEKMIHFLL